MVEYPYYILEGKKVVPTHDMFEWARLFEKGSRIVAQDTLPNGLRVSTVFLGVDMGWGNTKAPLVFETMIFDTHVVHRYQYNSGQIMQYNPDVYQSRYSTYDEAEKGHKAAITKFKRRKPTRRILHRVKRFGAGFRDGADGSVGTVKPEDSSPTSIN